MLGSVALLDANILYPAPLRDLFMQLAVSDVFCARWSADIHEEWINALLRDKQGYEREKLEKTRRLMDTATRDAVITGYQKLIPSLSLPDPNDRHVLAAAIIGECDVIVTNNVKDFPEKTLQIYDIKAQKPDDFLFNHFLLEPEKFCEAVKKVRGRLKNPYYDVHEYLNILLKQGLESTVTALSRLPHRL